MPDEKNNGRQSNVIVIAESQDLLCNQFHAVATLANKSANDCKRYIILTILKWIHDKGFPCFTGDPKTYADVEEKWFASFSQEEAHYGIHVASLAKTGEWAIRFRYMDAKDSPRTFTDRIALRPLDENRVEIGYQERVTIPAGGEPIPYGFRPSWLSSLLNVGTHDKETPSGVTLTQANVVIDPHHVQRLDSKKACSDVVQLWKNPQTFLPFVFIAEPAKKQNTPDISAAIAKLGLPASSNASFTPTPRTQSVTRQTGDSDTMPDNVIEFTHHAGGYARVWFVSTDELPDFAKKTGIELPAGGAAVVDPSVFGTFPTMMKDSLANNKVYKNIANPTVFETVKTASRNRSMGRTVSFGDLQFYYQLAPLCLQDEKDNEHQAQQSETGATIKDLRRQLADVTKKYNDLRGECDTLGREKEEFEQQLTKTKEAAEQEYAKLKKAHEKDLRQKDEYIKKLEREKKELAQQTDMAPTLPEKSFFADNVFPAYCAANWPDCRTAAEKFDDIVHLYCLIHGITFVNDYETKPAFIDTVTVVRPDVGKTNYADHVSFIEKFCERLSHQLDESKTTTPRNGEKLYGGDNRYHFCVSGAGRIFYHFKRGGTTERPCLVLDKYDHDHSD